LTSRARAWPAAAALAALLVGGCAPGDRRDAASGTESPLGAGPAVHLLESHASALVVWAAAGVRDRVVVHLDARPGVDWLPDDTIARMAAAEPLELAALAADPGEALGDALARFSSSNFLYAAARLGIAREVVWVVPDATFDLPDARMRLVRDVLVARLQGVTPDEARGFRDESGRMRGRINDVALTICRLADLPDLPDGVLLDVDLSFLTARSALSPAAAPESWIDPGDLPGVLEARGVRPDVITVSLSTLGGYAPAESRWIGRELEALFRGEPVDRAAAAARGAGATALAAGEAGRAAALYRDVLRAAPEDGSAWYALAQALEKAGEPGAAREALRRAERHDPILAHATLFDADRLWDAARIPEALERYEAYLGRHARDRYGVHVERRRGGCLVRMGQVEAGTEALRAVVARAPDHAAGRHDLGVALLEQRQAAAAAEHLAAARDASPSVAQYRLDLAAAYLAERRTLEAMREMDEALRLRPCFVAARARLAQVLLRQGRAGDAAPHAAVAVALQPGNPGMRLLASQIDAALGGPGR
jgi:tetratricopeptide (TPR) repeat protein